MAQIAASIEYETASLPAGLPDDMHALPGASLRFLSIKAIDEFKVQAALWEPESKPPLETTIIVQVHGSGGNLLYARDPARFGATTGALAVARDELAVAEEQWLTLEMLREEIEAAESRY
jgi:hypothetical protein